MDYSPQKITIELIRKCAKAEPPKKPREIRDRARSLVLRHQPSGHLSIYVQLGRGKRERLCNARDILEEQNPLTLGAVFNDAKLKLGESAGGRDFKGERDAKRRIPTFSDFLKDDYEPYVLKALRSGKERVASLKSQFEDDFGNLKLDEIDVGAVKKWRNKREGVTPATVNRIVTDLRSMLSYAVHDAEVLPVHPLAGLKPLKADGEIVVRALEIDEQKRLREALKARDEKMRAERASANEWRAERRYTLKPAIGEYADALTPAVLVSIETGLRRNELFSLEWPLVDFKAKEIHVTAATAKTDRARTIPLNAGALDVIRKWWLQGGQPKAGFVFPGAKGKLGSLRKAYYKVLTDAGIKRTNAKGERVNWHSLRHSFGSRLGAENVDPVTIQKLMGHSQLTTTARYLHSEGERMRAAVEKLA
jgi:integrase